MVEILEGQLICTEFFNFRRAKDDEGAKVPSDRLQNLNLGVRNVYTMNPRTTMLTNGAFIDDLGQIGLSEGRVI